MGQDGGVQYGIRRAGRDDVPAVVELNGIIQGLHYGRRPDWFKPVDAASFVSIVGRWLDSPDAVVFVAEQDGEVIGYAAGIQSERSDHPLVHPATYVELDQIVVALTHRGRGIGRALGERVISWAESQGVQRVEVATWAFDDAAVPLFEQLGFTPTVQRMSRSLGR